ncbi:nucleolar protein dao-5-like [Haliotis asinina]|uniref:nucleolar protein dao-5-like n=1 Tax=Haliotis asinina TaxID=109174 RepID=UPI0035320C38
MMEQTVAVKEMFDGLYNIIVGPGFYTVSGAKKKMRKFSKSCPKSVTPHEDMMSSVSDQDSSKEGKEYKPSTENVGDFVYKSSAGSDTDVICDDNSSSVNDPNTVFVSHELSNDITRTECTVTSEHKHNNVCDTAVILQGKQTTGDKSVCASVKSKLFMTKDQGCTSRFGYSMQPTDLTRSSRGNCSKNSGVSVVRVDGSDVTSKHSWPLQGDVTSKVPDVSHVSHKASKSELTSKHSLPLQGEGPTDISHVSHKVTRSDVTSKKSWSSQREGPSDASWNSHISLVTNRSDVTSKTSWSLQGERPSNVHGVSHASLKANKSDVTSKQFWSSQGEGLSAVPGVSRMSHKTNLEGADLTISSRRSLGRLSSSPEKAVKRRIQPSLSVGPVKLRQEQNTSASILKSDDERSVTINDLTISSRRPPAVCQLSPEKCVRCRRQLSNEETSLSVNGVKLQEEQKIASSILMSDDERPVTIPGCAPCSRRDVDAQSDISTDSHTSGYTQSRPAVLPQPPLGKGQGDGHRKLRKKTAPEYPRRRLSSSPLKKSAGKSDTKISPVKRKHDGDSSETLCGKKAKSSHGSREKSSKSKMIADKHKKLTPTRKKARTKTRRNDKENKTKQLKQNTRATVNHQRLLSLRGLINLKKPKQCSNQSPAKCSSRSSLGHSVRRQLRSSTLNMSAKHISQAAHKTSPRKQSLRGRGMQKTQYCKHKQNRHHSSTKQKVHARNSRRSDSKHRSKQALAVKQGSDINKHRSKSKTHRRRRSADSFSVQEALVKQQQVIDEHSKEKNKFEDGNIISALCQLEDKAKTLHSHDLELLMPMSDLSTNRNAFLGVRGQGQSNHPGGVWKKLIPEN